MIKEIKTKIVSNNIQYSYLFIILFLAILLGLMIPMISLTQLALVFSALISIVWAIFNLKSFILAIIVLFPILMGINFPSPIGGVRFGLDVLISLLLILIAILVGISKKSLKNKKIITLFVIYIIIMVLSTFQSLDVINSISFIIRQISYISIIFLIPTYFTSENDKLIILVAIILASLVPTIQALYGFFENIQTLQIIGHKVTYRAGFFSAAGGPWALSAFLLSVVVATYSVKNYLAIKRRKRFVFLLWVYLLVLFLGVISTFYRVSWIALSMMIVVASRKRKKILLVFILFLLIVILAMPAISDRMLQAFDMNSSMYGRFYQWEWTINQLLANPSKFFTGFGRGSYGIMTQSDSFSYLNVKSAHNYYLSVLFDNGIFGLIIFVILLIYIFFRSIKTRNHSIKIDRIIHETILLLWIGFIVMSISTSPLSNPASAFYFWVIVSLGDNVSKKPYHEIG